VRAQGDEMIVRVQSKSYKTVSVILVLVIIIAITQQSI